MYINCEHTFSQIFNVCIDHRHPHKDMLTGTVKAKKEKVF